MLSTSFPYGAFPVDEHFRSLYETNYSKASLYRLPDSLPHHHPLLKALEGTYPLHDQPAPWWPACIAEVDPALRKVLSTISLREFREGCLEQARWKQFRQACSDHERAALPQSPKLAPLLENTNWGYHFTQRGASDTPERLDLVISSSPLHTFYMSNGHNWTSCQHFREGEYNECLAGTFYDTGLATVFALAPQTNVWEDGTILARTTLRVFGDQGHTWIAIGQIYHNNETLAYLLLCQLTHLFDTHQLPWGFLIGVNSLTYCKKGLLGLELKQRIAETESTRMWSDPFWLPPNFSEPYVDGGEHYWDRTIDFSHRLQATLQLMKPLTLPHCAA